MHEVSFDEAIEQIRIKDSRYQRDSYHFVREALDFTKKGVSKQSDDPVWHVTGQELLGGIREFALVQFGPMAMTVLAEWGIRTTEDFGEIVFNMVDVGLLAKTEKDSRADFQNVYDFFDAFRRPFIPEGKPLSTEPEESSGPVPPRTPQAQS
jgi:uncharacterized repeat protein (TIGR04138 family)